jgi:hypothetical protein
VIGGENHTELPVLNPGTIVLEVLAGGRGKILPKARITESLPEQCEPRGKSTSRVGLGVSTDRSMERPEGRFELGPGILSTFRREKKAFPVHFALLEAVPAPLVLEQSRPFIRTGHGLQSLLFRELEGFGTVDPSVKEEEKKKAHCIPEYQENSGPSRIENPVFSTSR